MNLTWHILRKDVFRLRWILLLWLVVLAAQLALGDIQAAVIEEGFGVYYWITFIFSTVFLPVMSFGLVMGVQDDDPVCDTDAFWITRPISSQRLMAAKASGLVLLWLVPVLVTTPWLLMHGYDAGQLAHAGWRILKVQVFITLLALPLAVISPNASRFVLHAMLAVAGFLFLELIYWLGHPGLQQPRTPGVRESLAWVLVALWALGAFLMAFIQYRYRRTRQAVLVMVWIGLAGFAVCLGWSWDLHPRNRTPADLEPTRNFPLEFRSATVEPEAVGNPARPIVTTEFRAAGLPVGEATTVTAVTHHFQWAEGSFSLPLTPPVEHALVPACVALICGQGGEPAVQTPFRLPPDVAARLGHEGLLYSAEIAGQLSRLEIVAEMPLETGAKSVLNGESVRVGYFVPFLQFEHGLVIPVRETKPVFKPMLPAWFLPEPVSAEAEFYFLVNRGDGRVLQATVVREADATLDVATLRYASAILKFAPGQEVRGSFPDDLRTWLKQATLIKIVAHAAGTFRGTAPAAHFALTKKGAAPASIP